MTAGRPAVRPGAWRVPAAIAVASSTAGVLAWSSSVGTVSVPSPAPGGSGRVDHTSVSTGLLLLAAVLVAVAFVAATSAVLALRPGSGGGPSGTPGGASEIPSDPTAVGHH